MEGKLAMKSFASRLTIRARLFALALAILLPLLVSVAWEVVRESEQAREYAYDQARIVSRGVAARIAAVLGEHQSVLERLALRPEMRALDRKRCELLIFDLVELHPDLTNLLVRDVQGNAICSYLPNPSPAAKAHEFPWFQEGVRGGAFAASNAFFGPNSDKWVTVLTYPVRDDAGKVSALLVMPIDLTLLANRVLTGTPVPMTIAVTDRENRVLMRSAKMAERVGKPMAPELAELSRKRSEGTTAAYGQFGAYNFYAFTAMPETGWRVWAAIPEATVLGAYRNQLVHGILATIPVLLLILAAVWWIAKSIAMPMNALSSTAARVADGDLAARARPAGPAEVETVALQFNRMLDALERHRADREAIAGHYADLLKQARDIVLLIDPEMRVVEANEAALAAYGYTSGEILSLRSHDLRAPDAIATLARDWEDSRRPEGVLVDTVHRRKDGSTFPVELSARVIEIDGKPYRQCFVRDITARKQAEAQKRESEAKFRAVVEFSPEGIFIQTGGRFEYANAEALRIFGYSRTGELIGQPVIERFHPDCRDRVRERIRLLNEERRPADPLDEVCLRADGSTVDVIVSAIPFDYEGRAGALAFARDISERKRTEDHMREQVDELRRWQAAMLGREARVIELKGEVNDLLAAAGQSPRYAVVQPIDAQGDA